MPKTTEKSRLFFALWPEQPLAEQIHYAVQAPLRNSDGKRVPECNFHITLVFYGSADARQRACLELAADKITARRFNLNLSQLGYFAKPKVIWLAPDDIPDALTQLQFDLSQVLVEQCAYQAEQRPYRPHLTLARKSRQAPSEKVIDAVSWQVHRFVLVQSITRPEGAEYRVLKEWELSG